MDLIKFKVDVSGRRNRHLLRNVCTNESIDRGGNPYRHATVGTMKLKLNSSNTELEVNGSLHKYQKGNNYSHFYRSEILMAVTNLCNYLGIEKDRDVNFLELEYGINVETELTPFNYYSRLLRYKSNDYLFNTPKKGSTKIWGKTCHSSTGTIKLYDKRLQTLLSTDHYSGIGLKSTLPPNLLRYELKFYKPKLISHLTNLKSLYSKDFLMQMHINMIDKLEESVRSKHFNCKIMTPSDYKLAMIWQVNEYVDNIKKHHNETYKKEFKKYNDICVKYSHLTDPIDELIKKVQDEHLKRILL